MQREMLRCVEPKKILASHKKTRYYASHRMLKRSRRGSKARAKQDPSNTEPRQRSERKRLPTCHGCLLHPPPLVDLARDLTISGFFLSQNNASPFMRETRPSTPDEAGAEGARSCPGVLRVFPWIFRMYRGGKLYNYCMKSVFPRAAGRVAASPAKRGSTHVSRPGCRTLRSVPVICTSLSLPYMGVTPAADNGRPVSIDQPEVTL